MTIKDIAEHIEGYRRRGLEIFATSSFQTHSIPMLHILHRIDRDIDVLFINTGFHFPETLSFRDKIAEDFGLNVIDVRPSMPKNQQMDDDGNLFFVSDPDYCCYLNKTQPLEPYLKKYDVWISGVRASQSQARSGMNIEEKAPFGTIRFHPMLDWTSKEIHDYRKKYELPEHPLDKYGYQSIGCAPCTRKFDPADERSARWFGLNKEECGLHTELISR
ncbi:MAG: phosphoadenylyl-sulfate reductase [Saprospiraceae bacterium]|nr:phosphoadenylyl-sulfate reductase [Saprospiraceae bacterium]